MDLKEIKELIPHRDSMLLIDKLDLIDGIAYGEKTIIGNEWFLNGHFPGNPIVPGVILCEILGQTASILLQGKIDKGLVPYFTGLDKVRFKKPVSIGDTIKTECQIVKSKEHFYWAKGKGYVNGELCVSAEFSIAIPQSSKFPHIRSV